MCIIPNNFSVPPKSVLSAATMLTNILIIFYFNSLSTPFEVYGFTKVINGQ